MVSAEIQEKLKTFEKIKEQNRNRANRFYYRHREEIRKKQKQKLLTNNETIPCDCGGKYKIRFIKVHFKTAKHLKFIENSKSK